MVGLIKRNNLNTAQYRALFLVYKILVRSHVDYNGHHTGSVISKPWRKYKRRQQKNYQKSVI